jgi:hypothetical protein
VREVVTSLAAFYQRLPAAGKPPPNLPSLLRYENVSGLEQHPPTASKLSSNSRELNGYLTCDDTLADM